mmetsp:Transcript_68767/g.121482  ORF Transcript_68767/g.121482 Transcript_68767/m.121482 type:complete len:237 (+) Transcript_68767:1151-1861(+)
MIGGSGLGMSIAGGRIEIRCRATYWHGNRKGKRGNKDGDRDQNRAKKQQNGGVRFTYNPGLHTLKAKDCATILLPKPRPFVPYSTLCLTPSPIALLGHVVLKGPDCVLILLFLQVVGQLDDVRDAVQSHACCLLDLHADGYTLIANPLFHAINSCQGRNRNPTHLLDKLDLLFDLDSRLNCHVEDENLFTLEIGASNFVRLVFLLICILILVQLLSMPSEVHIHLMLLVERLGNCC